MNIEEYLNRLLKTGSEAGFKISHYGNIGEVELPVLERIVSRGGPQLYLSSGVHGNEPAGPVALLEMLEQGSFPLSLNLTIFPMVNPLGLAAGTRENPDGIDLNRDYGSCPLSYETGVQTAWLMGRVFDLAICLHEDDDGEGFYIYSHVSAKTEQDFPGLAIEAARPFTGVDQRRIIDEMPAREGRMYPPDSVVESFGDNLPEALRLRDYHNSRYTFTTETPSRQPLEVRVQAQKAAVSAILKAYLSEM